MNDDELQSILETAWARLAKAVDDPADPWRLPAFGTQGLSGPSVRTMVLRTADFPIRTLTAQTDFRSTKVPGFRKDPRVAWSFFDPQTKEQLRATGRAVIHHNDETTERAWPSVPETNQQNYATTHAPGAAIDHPALGQAQDTDFAKAYENFAVIRCEITEIDWLQLAPDFHRRAQFKWNGSQWLANWAVP